VNCAPLSSVVFRRVMRLQFLGAAQRMECDYQSRAQVAQASLSLYFRGGGGGGGGGHFCFQLAEGGH
jgi:hypothetical protein